MITFPCVLDSNKGNTAASSKHKVLFSNFSVVKNDVFQARIFPSFFSPYLTMIALSNGLFSTDKLLLSNIWKEKKRAMEVSSCDDSFNFDKLFTKTQTDKHIDTTGNCWYCTPRDQMLVGRRGWRLEGKWVCVER